MISHPINPDWNKPKEYQAWEFCEAVECRATIMMNEASRKEYCKNCRAYQFHDYLQQQGYRIVKEGKA